jgi:hypothetical protein
MRYTIFKDSVELKTLLFRVVSAALFTNYSLLCKTVIDIIFSLSDCLCCYASSDVHS